MCDEMMMAELAVMDERFMRDPYPEFAMMRAGQPVRRMRTTRGLTVWVVTRYADARAALVDPRLTKGLFAASLSAHMLNSDPPEHARLRRLVNKAFTARRVESLRPRVVEIADQLITSMAAEFSVDLLSSFAYPLPITVICELLGVPLADREHFVKWSNALTSATRARAEVTAATTAMTKYLTGLIQYKTIHPADDLLSELICARDEGSQLNRTELLSMVFLLLVGGYETTAHTISNGLLALLRTPDQMAALRADRSLLVDAVEEFLRYDCPVNMATLRQAQEPIRLGDVEISTGEVVMVSIASANRDEGKFSAADNFDITGSTNGHLAFGHGIHYCLGASLARMEVEIAIGRLLDAFPSLELDCDPAELQWQESTLIRGLTRFPLRLFADHHRTFRTPLTHGGGGDPDKSGPSTNLAEEVVF